MKAVVCHKYGAPEALRVEEVAKPSLKEDEVLVKVHATAINDYDWSMVRGKPLMYRLLFGLTKPRKSIPGMELSGTIEKVGDKTTLFQVGDKVYGDTSGHAFGTFAEYICVNEKALVPKPDSMSFEEAATIPHAAMLAIQGLHDKGEIKNGQRVLINGAGGGVGTFGLQLAKLQHAEVTGVDTGPKLEMMKSIGFDHVIDYKQENFTRNGQRYDLILDAKTTRSPFAYLRSLKPNGIYVTVGGRLSRLLQALLLGGLIARLTGKRIRILALKPNKDLPQINKLFEAGKLKCMIDGPYALEKTPWAIQYFGEGKHSGKVVISVVAKNNE